MFRLSLYVLPPPQAWIETSLDAVKDIRAGLGSRPAVLAIHTVAFEHPKEALVRRVVGAAARGTHAAGHVMRLQEPQETEMV